MPAVATIKEVARLAGVSTATVSKALNSSGRVSDVLQARVAAAAQTLGYAPHASARSLRSGETRILGLLVADITNPYFLRLVESLEQIASAQGYSVLLCNSNEDAERERRNLGMLVSQRVDGIVLIPTRESWPNRVGSLAGLSAPVVLVDRPMEGLDADTVTIDNRMAGRLAAEHLLALGHRRVGVIMGSPEHTLARHRLDGFRQTLAANGIMLDDALVERNHFTEEAAFEGATRMLSRADRPTAVFATNNHMAFGLLGAVTELGMTVPRDIAIVAVDRLPWTGRRSGIAAIVQPSADIARSAIGMLLQRIGERDEPVGGPVQSVVLQPHLEAGGSTLSILEAE